MPGQGPAAALTSQMRPPLFLSCKEALHNVVKHAGASEVTLGVAVKEGALVVTIADNGRGRTGAAGSRTPSRWAAGQGTANRHRRLAAMGGRCEITDAAAGAGTVVTLTMPLAESL